MSTRSRSPPMLMRGFIRSVWLLNPDNTFRRRRRGRPGADPVLVARHRSLPQIACLRQSRRRDRCRCDVFDEAITPREPGPGEMTLCGSAAQYSPASFASAVLLSAPQAGSLTVYAKRTADWTLRLCGPQALGPQ